MSPFKVGALLCATSFLGIYSYFQFAASDSYTTDIAYIDGQVITHRAPHDATVKEVKVSPGQMTNDNTTLFLLNAPALEDALHHASLDVEALTEKYAALSAQLNQLRITESALQNEYQLANQAVLTSHELSGIYRAAQKQGNVDKITVTQHHIEHLTLEQSAHTLQRTLSQNRHAMLSMEAELTEIKSHTTARLYDKDSLAEQHNTLRIIAPNTAVITEIAVGQGEYVNKGDMLGQSVNTQTIHVVAYYNEDSLAHIKPGDTVNVYIDALKRTITGRIRAIGALAGGSAASASVNYTTGYVARVKQRVPVYIDAASAKERVLLQQLPLGLSIRVSKP